MFVAVHFAHIEGRVAAIISGPAFDSNLLLVDTSGVDASLASFTTEEEAELFLQKEEVDLSQLTVVPGGRLLVEDY